MRCICAVLVALLLALDGARALAPLSALSRRSRVSRDFNVGLRLYAKKPNRETKGFGKVKENAVLAPVDGKAAASELAISTAADPSGSSTSMSSSSSNARSGTSGSSTSAPTDAEAIFKKYGIQDGEQQQKKAAKKAARGEDAPFGESVMAGIPAQMQDKIDNVLITLTFLSLCFVVLTGVGMSAGALKVVFKDLAVPEAFDAIVTNLLTPAFTPALLIFLFFSVTFGLFKFAQISSDQTVYRES